MLFDPSKRDLERKAGASEIEPVKVLIFHGILVAGFLAVHFGVARLW